MYSLVLMAALGSGADSVSCGHYYYPVCSPCYTSCCSPCYVCYPCYKPCHVYYPHHDGHWKHHHPHAHYPHHQPHWGGGHWADGCEEHRGRWEDRGPHGPGGPGARPGGPGPRPGGEGRMWRAPSPQPGPDGRRPGPNPPPGARPGGRPGGPDGGPRPGPRRDQDEFESEAFNEESPEDGAEAEAPVTEGSATIVVRVPADATLYVDGTLVELNDETRIITTPELEEGRDYSYTFKARVTREGQAVVQTRRVAFRAGSVARVDFGNLERVAAEQRPETPEAAPARVTVRLPAEARLSIDGVECPLTSGMRSFETPELPAGRTYYYTLKAELVRDGRTHSETRRVPVSAGEETQVSLGLTAANIAQR